MESLEASTQKLTVARANEINTANSTGSPGIIGRCAHLLAYLTYPINFQGQRSLVLAS